MSGLLLTSETSWITSTVTSALDQSLPLYRPTASSDGYGHDTYTYPGSATHTIACNVTKPSATVLQAYANVIGSRRSLVLRVMSGTDVLENDRIVYDSLNWVVQAEMEPSSYSVTKQFIMTVVV